MKISDNKCQILQYSILFFICFLSTYLFNKISKLRIFIFY